MQFIGHIPKFIELATKVVSGLQVAYDVFDNLRNEYLDWKNNRKRSLSVLTPKEQGAVQVLEQFLRDHPNFYKVLANKEVPTKRMLQQFTQSNSNTNPFADNAETNPFLEKEEQVERPGKVKSGELPMTNQVMRNGKVYAVTSAKNVNYGPAGAYYKANGFGSVLSHTPIDEARVADLTLEDLKESLWLRNSLHSSDAMALAQMFPGERAVPYYDGENLPKLGAGILQLTDTFGTSTNNWTIMCWSPTIGALYAGDGYWDAQGSDNAFANNTTQSAPVAWNLQKPGYSTPTSGLIASGFSYLYTASSPFSENVFPWSAEMSVTIEAPSAIVGGTVYRALVPSAQFYAGLSYRNILTIAQREPVEHGRTYSIRTSVQNRNLVHFIPWTNSTSSVVNVPIHDELVAVMMIHNPAVSLTGGTPASYDLIQKVKINYAYAPKFSNPWTAAMSVDDASLDFKELLPRRFKEFAKGGETPSLNSRVGNLKVTNPSLAPAGGSGGNSGAGTNPFLNSNANGLRSYCWSPNEANDFLQNIKSVLKLYDLPVQMVESYDLLLEASESFKTVISRYLSGEFDPDKNKQVLEQKLNDSFRQPQLRK